MKLMKRVWAALLLLAASGQLYADEGMWVLKELNNRIWREWPSWVLPHPMISCIVRRILAWRTPW